MNADERERRGVGVVTSPDCHTVTLSHINTENPERISSTVYIIEFILTIGTHIW